MALASERDRADALTRERASVRNELEAGNWQTAALNAVRALHLRESAVDKSQERMAESPSRTTEGKGRSPEQISGEAVASTSSGAAPLNPILIGHDMLTSMLSRPWMLPLHTRIVHHIRFECKT
jgi:hypothetical protein